LTKTELSIRVEVPLKGKKGESSIFCVAQKHSLLRIHHTSVSQRWPDLSTGVREFMRAYVCKSSIHMEVLVLFLKNTTISILVRNSWTDHKCKHYTVHCLMHNLLSH
jgi:hypothetical protein